MTLKIESKPILSENYNPSEHLAFKPLPLELHKIIVIALVEARPFDVNRLSTAKGLTNKEVCSLAERVVCLSLTNKFFYCITQSYLKGLKEIHNDYKDHQALLDAPRFSFYFEEHCAFQNIVTAFGGVNKFYTFPVLDISGRNGLTGYIDFIRPKDFIGKGSAILVGKDDVNRPFFSLLVKSKNPIPLENLPENHKIIIKEQDQIGFVLTFFQRYMAGADWVYALSGLHIDSTNLASNRYVETITNIMSSEHPDFILGDPQAVKAYYDAPPEEL